MKEHYITLRVTADEAGNITKIELPEHLPDMEITTLMTFLSCIERAKVK